MFWNVLGQHFSGIAEGGWFHKKTILPKWKQRLLLNWSEQITKLKHLKPSLTSATPASACVAGWMVITKGFEEDVGNKTSVYVHTAHSITSSRYILKKHGYKAAPHDEVMKLFIGPWFLFYFTRVKMASLSSFSFWQGIKYVMIPEGMRDYQWLEGLLKGEKVSAGPYRKRLWVSTKCYVLLQYLWLFVVLN